MFIDTIEWTLHNASLWFSCMSVPIFRSWFANSCGLQLASSSNFEAFSSWTKIINLKLLYFFLWGWNVMKIVFFQQLVMKRWIQLLHSISCNLFSLKTPLFMFQVLLKVFCYGKQLLKRKMEVGDNNIIHSGIVNISGCSVKIRLL